MFKTILKLAYKNSFLRLSRTILVILMIAVSMSMMLSLQGLYDGMTLNMIESIKRSDSGEISLYAKGYRLDPDIKNSISNASTIRKEIEALDGVEAVTLRLGAEGLGSTARKSSFSTVYGIDLKDEEKFGRFSEFLKRGEISFEKRGAIVGIELAKTLKVKIGSKIIFSTQDSHGEISSMVIKVRGVVQTANMALDNTAIYIEKSKLYDFLNIDETKATQIAVRGDNDRLQESIKTAYPHLDTLSFLELYPMMKQMEDVMVIFNGVTFIIVMLVVFMGILGVMYVSILDRIREFGIMLSIGMHYGYIRLQIILEALLVGVFGYLLGALLGLVILLYLKEYGVDLTAFADGLESFGMNTTIYADIKLSYFSTTFVAIIMASLLSVILPLRRIKKLNPIEVIKANR
ncbi:ABC transporter permease [Sulfurovum sp. bin170]|uniref:ABC transporter permease n=1 Tax=Sulfurovum sp. bin170 TaxID=2695268 RepID=UPI0013DECF66|nr:FtsX-like permease family protein [Sulfurovum sp. bin170]NEW61423.1 ABC transporter permease [Sulfurovum sp. bin170]